MIDAVPASARVEPLTFALTSEAVREVRRLLALHERDAPDTSSALLAFFQTASPRPPDLRRTPLDPRLPSLLTRLRANEYVAVQLEHDAGEGEVYAEVERNAMFAGLRLLRLVEMDAPGIILQSGALTLDEHLAGLRLPPQPTPHPGPDDCERTTLDLVDGIVRNARDDLSVGMHAETIRVLDALANTERCAQLSALLSSGPALLDLGTIERDLAKTRDRFFLKRATTMRWGPDAARLAETLTTLAQELASTASTTRNEVTAELDSHAPAELLGDDYVASAALHFRALAVSAETAAQQGLELLSDLRLGPTSQPD